MAQLTTEEFSERLNQAVEGHPLAPPTPFGRQSWLRDKLRKEAALDVSPNTIHKWTKGMSRPREDNIRQIAKVLSVDEVWLSQGRRPTMDKAAERREAVKARGATLLIAGMIEMMGGRVTFPGPEDDGVSLWADLGHGRTGLVVVTGQAKGSTVSYMIPEPVGDNRIIAVSLRSATAPCVATGCIDMTDLTETPRQHFGGFSVVQGETRKDGRMKVEGQRNLLMPMTAVEELIRA